MQGKRVDRGRRLPGDPDPVPTSKSPGARALRAFPRGAQIGGRGAGTAGSAMRPPIRRGIHPFQCMYAHVTWRGTRGWAYVFSYTVAPRTPIFINFLNCVIYIILRPRDGKPPHGNVRQDPNAGDHSSENCEIFPDAHVGKSITHRRGTSDRTEKQRRQLGGGRVRRFWRTKCTS